MRNYIAFFDKATLLQLMRETGYNTYQIMEAIEPCSYLDDSGRALSNNFIEPDVRYVDFNSLKRSYIANNEERKVILKLYQSMGIERLCKETKISIRKIHSMKLCKVNRDKMYEWRNSK